MQHLNKPLLQFTDITDHLIATALILRLYGTNISADADGPRDAASRSFDHTELDARVRSPGYKRRSIFANQTVNNGGVFLLRRTDPTDLARRVCRSFIRPSVSFLVFLMTD